jgi:hypothetical protein
MPTIVNNLKLQREAEAVLADACTVIKNRADANGIARIDDRVTIITDFHLGASVRTVVITNHHSECVFRACWDRDYPADAPLITTYRPASTKN